MIAWPPCIVLAGGLGSRLRGAVGDIPKCLAPVGDKLFIDIQIDSLRAAGIHDVILALGHKASQVLGALRESGRAAHIRNIVEPTPLGTGGAIAFVMEQLGLEEVLVANGDTYINADFAGMRPGLDLVGGELMRMAVMQCSDRGRFGGVKIGTNRRVESFVEKGQQGQGAINVGLYRLCRSALPSSSMSAYSLELDILPTLAARGAITALQIDGDFTDIGVPDDYYRFCAQHAG